MGTRIEHWLVQPRVVAHGEPIICTKIPLPMMPQRLHGLNCSPKKGELPRTFWGVYKDTEKACGITILGYRFDGEIHQGFMYLAHQIPRTFETTVPHQNYTGGIYERVNRTIRQNAAH